MKRLEELICSAMHDFLSEHISELTKTPYDLGGWKSESEMLVSIKEHIQDAIWVLTELIWWGLPDGYEALFVKDCFEDENIVYGISGRLFMVDYDNWVPIEVKRVGNRYENITE